MRADAYGFFEGSGSKALGIGILSLVWLRVGQGLGLRYRTVELSKVSWEAAPSKHSILKVILET